MSRTQTTVALPDGWAYITVDTQITVDNATVSWDHDRGCITLDLGRFYLELSPEKWHTIADAVAKMLPEAVPA